MKYITLIIVFLLIASNLLATDKSYLFRQDTIVLTMSAQNILLYKHKLNKQDKIEDLSMLFGTNTDQILQVNNSASIGSLSNKKEIIIPVSEKSLVTEETYKYDRQQYIPVVYQVKSKDNLFRIARHYFFQSLDDLMARNNMEDYNLDIGDQIHVGWLSTKPKDAIEIEISDPINAEPIESEEMVFDGLVDKDVINDEELKDVVRDSSTIEIEEPIIFMVSQGKGMWDKKVRDNGKLLALHEKAKIGSTIELKNSMLNRTIKAKVIGRIPKNVYPDDITVLVGPAAAKSLGVIDAKFFVEIRYIE